MSLHSQQAKDIQYLSRAILLAKNGLYTTGPNPRVGCVIVKQGQIIAEGWHQLAGDGHAEVNALKRIKQGQNAEGACAYVSLEPCSHQGKTGPCADALIAAGITRVVCSMKDPATHVSGKGFEKLKKAGVEVDVGLLQAEAEALNPGFIKRAIQQLPYVRLKMAMSIDGRTAMASGESQWITGPNARNDVQQWRARSDAIVTGVGSVLSDDPQMTIRPSDQWVAQWPESVPLTQPIRVVLDSQLRFPLDAKMCETIHETKGRIIIATLSENAEKASKLSAKGIEIWLLPSNAQKVDLKTLLERLAAEGINEVWVESGATLSGAFVSEALVDEMLVYMAPTLLGSTAKPLLDLPLDNMADQKKLKIKDMRMIGNDVRYILKAEK